MDLRPSALDQDTGSAANICDISLDLSLQASHVDNNAVPNKHGHGCESKPAWQATKKRQEVLLDSCGFSVGFNRYGH